MIQAWAPMFRISMGIPRLEFQAMSVPEMIDHLDYLEAVTRGSD